MNWCSKHWMKTHSSSHDTCEQQLSNFIYLTVYNLVQSETTTVVTYSDKVTFQGLSMLQVRCLLEHCNNAGTQQSSTFLKQCPVFPIQGLVACYTYIILNGEAIDGNKKLLLHLSEVLLHFWVRVEHFWKVDCAQVVALKHKRMFAQN